MSRYYEEKQPSVTTDTIPDVTNHQNIVTDKPTTTTTQPNLNDFITQPQATNKYPFIMDWLYYIMDMFNFLIEWTKREENKYPCIIILTLIMCWLFYRMSNVKIIK